MCVTMEFAKEHTKDADVHVRIWKLSEKKGGKTRGNLEGRKWEMGVVVSVYYKRGGEFMMSGQNGNWCWLWL